MKILWVSRHSPFQKQIEELKRKFGADLELIKVSTKIRDPYEIKQLMEEYECDDVVAVVPLSMRARLTSIGINPIKAVMSRKVIGHVNGQFEEEVVWEHENFERVLNVKEVTCPL